MSFSKQLNIGSLIKAEPGIALTSAAISSTSTGTGWNGATIDRFALARRYQSCKSILRGRLTASTDIAIAFGLSFQHSSDGTSFDNFSTATNASKTFGSTSASSGQAVEDAVEQSVNLAGARRYVRQVGTYLFTGTSAGSNAYASGSVIFGGSDELPATS